MVLCEDGTPEFRDQLHAELEGAKLKVIVRQGARATGCWGAPDAPAPLLLASKEGSYYMYLSHSTTISPRRLLHLHPGLPSFRLARLG